MKNNCIAIALLLLLCVCSASPNAEDSPAAFDLLALEGDWSGSGSFVVPVTGMEMAIEGRASFQYDSTAGYLRTVLTGAKLFFTYVDSGTMWLDPATDSLTWEIWDGFGKHVIYRGVVDGSSFVGSRLRGSRVYTVSTDFVTNDSISFRMTSRDAEGVPREKARFELGRIPGTN